MSPDKSHRMPLPPKKAISVLIAEDEPIIAAHLLALLKSMGHDVVGVAKEGMEAISRAERLNPDLVLMDIGLAGDMDGIDAATRMQRQLEIPVIFITGATDAATVERAVRMQPFGYVPKPFNEVEIRCAIEVALARHRAENILHRREHALLQYAESLRSRAFIDDLTGLYNRSGFLTLSRQHLKAAARHQRAWTLLFMDLNGLKKVNDTLGHDAGDSMLVAMAQVLLHTFRESDVIARLGGDEFVVLALESPTAGGRSVLKRLRKSIEEHNVKREPALHLSVSVGCAIPDPFQEESIEALLARADAHMYAEKRASRA
jgi:two-component system, cell cycle response regulator